MTNMSQLINQHPTVHTISARHLQRPKYRELVGQREPETMQEIQTATDKLNGKAYIQKKIIEFNAQPGDIIHFQAAGENEGKYVYDGQKLVSLRMMHLNTVR